MAKKPLGKDKLGIQKVMRMPDYLGDAAGQFSLNAISGLVGQLTYFYTEKVGVAAGAIATALLIVKILDAFTDIIMGYIVDHTAPGKEKYRPWILRMVLPVAIMMVLMFTVPTNVSTPIQIVYMFITNFLFTAVIYTIICVPYQAIMVVRTNSQEERAKMGTWRAAAGYVSGMIIAVMIIPITNILGADAVTPTYGFISNTLPAEGYFNITPSSEESNAVGYVGNEAFLLHELVAKSKEYQDLKDAEEQMFSNKELSALFLRYQKIQKDIDISSPKENLKKLHQLKLQIDSHPLVCDYKEKYQQFKILTDELKNIIFDDLLTKDDIWTVFKASKNALKK